MATRHLIYRRLIAIHETEISWSKVTSVLWPDCVIVPSPLFGPHLTSSHLHPSANTTSPLIEMRALAYRDDQSQIDRCTSALDNKKPYLICQVFRQSPSPWDNTTRVRSGPESSNAGATTTTASWASGAQALSTALKMLSLEVC